MTEEEIKNMKDYIESLNPHIIKRRLTKKEKIKNATGVVLGLLLYLLASAIVYFIYRWIRWGHIGIN